MPERYHLTVTVNYASGNEREIDLGEFPMVEIPDELRRLYTENVTSMVVVLIKA